MADSLFGFAFGGQIQSHCGLDCLGNHKYSIVWCWVCLLAYTYDTGNNLTNLSHQANSGNWQQTLAIHPNSNRGTFNHTADLIALVIINIVLCGVGFVCFSQFI
jgi:hypothetical protein